MLKRSVALLLVLILPLLLMTSCTSGSTGSASPASTQGSTLAPSSAASASAGEKHILKISTGSEAIPTFDPTNVQSAGNMLGTRTAYEPLVHEKTGTTELEPWLALSWEIPDSTTYVFTLRDGVKFYDGTVMDAEDVVYSFKRAMSFTSSASSCVANINTIEATSPKTVTIKLKGADSGFLYNVAKIGIVSKEFCVKNEVNGDFGQNACQRATCGTGAYQLSEYVEDQYFTMVRFDGWWGAFAENAPDEVQNLFLDPTIQIQNFLSGDVDKVHMFLTEYIDQIKANPDLTLYSEPSLQTNIFTFNTQKAPTNDIRVRKAISLAFDYKSVCDSVYYGYATVPSGFMSTKFSDHNPNIPEQTFNLDEAKRILDEAGYKDLTVEMHILNMTDLKAMATMLQANLKKIGVNLVITEVDWLPMAEEHKNPEAAPNMATLCMGAFSGDADAYLRQCFDSMNSGGSYNWSFYENPEFDALCKSAAEATDAGKRQQYLYEAQKILVDDAPALFASNPMQVEAINNRWSGFVMHPLDYFWTVRFQELSYVK